MGRLVWVFSYEEDDENPTSFENKMLRLDAARVLFKDYPQVKVHAAIDETAEKIMAAIEGE